MNRWERRMRGKSKEKIGSARIASIQGDNIPVGRSLVALNLIGGLRIIRPDEKIDLAQPTIDGKEPALATLSHEMANVLIETERYLHGLADRVEQGGDPTPEDVKFLADISTNERKKQELDKVVSIVRARDRVFQAVAVKNKIGSADDAFNWAFNMLGKEVAKGNTGKASALIEPDWEAELSMYALISERIAG